MKLQKKKIMLNNPLMLNNYFYFYFFFNQYNIFPRTTVDWANHLQEIIFFVCMYMYHHVDNIIKESSN